jgi:hypothetical protein
MRHWLAAGALVFANSGCLVPETVRTDRKVSERFGPPTYEGTPTPRLTAQFSGSWIELLATSVRPCTRQQIEIVDQHVVHRAKLHGGPPPLAGGSDPVTAIVDLAIIGVTLIVLTLSALVTGVTLLVEHDEYEHTETPRTIRTQCAQPLASARVHLVFDDGTELTGLTGAQGRVRFDVPAEVPPKGQARASLEGASGDLVVNYDASSAPTPPPPPPAPQQADREDPR